MVKLGEILKQVEMEESRVGLVDEDELGIGDESFGIGFIQVFTLSDEGFGSQP